VGNNHLDSLKSRVDPGEVQFTGQEVDDDLEVPERAISTCLGFGGLDR
jgi:hypothetical protein